MTPENIGPYEVIRPLAQGGMAEVYEVRDPTSGERVALKLLIETRSSIKRFNREFEALTRLNHPSIVRVYHYGVHERMPWLTMELLDGSPLQTHIKGFGEPGDAVRTEEVIRVGWTLANALQYIHDRGLVHRDLKSANVQVLGDGRVKVFDFGTAHLTHALERITQDGDFVGTFSYASPEQIVGAAVDHRADLYSLGVLLYRLATGRRPFKASDPQKVAQMHLRQAARPVREFVPEVPEELERVIHWLLEKKRKDRPQSAEEVARALEVLAGKPLSLAGHVVEVAPDRPVGREIELRQAWNWLARRETPGLVVISGGDAMERSRVAASFGEDCARRGWRGVVVGRSEMPARAIVGALRGLAMRSDVPAVRELAGWLTEIRLLRLDGAELAAGLRERIGDLARDRALSSLVVLQEVQTWDTGALQLGTALADALVAERATASLVVTCDRSDCVQVRTLGRVLGDTLEIKLAPLDVRRVALTVAEMLHRRPPPMEVARRIHAESFGYPTRIERVVRRLLDQGELTVRSDDGNRLEWSLRSGLSAAADDNSPSEAEELLATVPAAARRLLEVLAVLGGSGAARPMAHALGWTEQAATLVLRELADLGVLEFEGRQGLVVVTDRRLLDEADRRMEPSRRRVVQQLLVDALPSDAANPALVRILTAMGRNEAAIRMGVAIGAGLLERGDAALALELLEPLRPAANHPGLDPATRCELYLLFGRCVRAVRPLDPTGVRSLHQADALAADPERKARVQIAFADLQAAIGHQTNYRKHLLAAWDLVGGRPASALHADIALTMAQNRIQEGDLAQATTWMERALQGATGAKSASGVLRAETGLAQLDVMRGRLAEAGERVERVLDGEIDPITRGEALVVRAQVLRRAGRFSEALAPLEQAVAEARVSGPPRLFLRLLHAVATIELDLMRLGAAQEVVDELIEGIALGERLHLRLAARLLQGRILMSSGQLAAAQLRLEEVVQQADLAGLALLAEEARAWQAEALWALGQRKESMELFRRAVLRVMEIGDLSLLADALVCRARAVGGLEDPERGFRMVLPLLDKPEHRVLYLEYLLAEHRWHRAKENTPEAERVLREAQMVFHSVTARQSRVEQAAMRVHPWMQEIKRAGSPS